jgi:hypothetical protein
MSTYLSYVGHLYDSFADIDDMFQYERKLELFYHRNDSNRPGSASNTSTDWLDRLTHHRITSSVQSYNTAAGKDDWLWGCSDDEIYFHHLSCLIIEFPINAFPVNFVYE